MSIPVAEVLARWSFTFAHTAMSSNDFYGKVETVLKDHQMPGTKIERVTHKEGGMFSSSREYLRAKHSNLVFDICAAPFGKHFFVSWWLYETEGMMSKLLKNTKVGDIMHERAAKRTFYEADKEHMFRTVVHNIVIEIIEQLGKESGMRELTEAERMIKEGGI